MKTTNASTSSQKKLTQETRKRSTNVIKTSTGKRNNSNSNINYELAEQAFPFQACRDDLEIDFSSMKRRSLLKGNNQYIYEALYHSIPVTVACLYKSSWNADATTLRENVFHHGLLMSDKLAACRGMNTHLFSFEALMESPNKAPGLNTPDKPAYCMVLPTNGCMDLKDFIEKCEAKYEKNKECEPIHPIVFVQIAISLFAMLRDAHLQRIGLVNISVESLKISTDQTLYFDDFKWCVDLDEPFNIEGKPWIQLEKLTCPESDSFHDERYHESADIFAAATVLANLIKVPHKSGVPYYRCTRTREVRLFSKRIRPTYSVYEDILKRCLSFDPKKRPTASEVLTWFEKQRKISFSDS